MFTNDPGGKKPADASSRCRIAKERVSPDRTWRAALPTSTTAILASVVVLHGVVDVALTLAVPHAESNPIVLALGWPAWLGVKAVATIGILAVGVWISRAGYEHVVRRCGAVLLVVGVPLIVPNVWWVL